MRIKEEEVYAKKQEEERLKKQIKQAKCEVKLSEMHQHRYMRDQMNRYQNKVVTELIRHPRTYYFFKASEEAIHRVRDKLKGKFDDHKKKLDDQKNRLNEIEKQFGGT